MKTILFYKSESNQITKHSLIHFLKVKELASSYDDSTLEKLYQLESEVYEEDFMKDKYVWTEYPGTFISKIEAQLLGEQLQPDRVRQDTAGNDYDYHFDLLDVNEAREIKGREIDENSLKLRKSGFVFNSRTFGCTIADQIQWNTIAALKNELTYPLENIVKDIDGVYYTVLNKTDMTNLIMTGLQHVTTNDAIGKSKKDAVKTKNTIQEVYDVVDDRT